MFVAIRPPEAAVESLAEFLEPRDGHRWIDPAQWHLTLAFLADVPEYRIDELGDALQDALARRASVRLRIAGAGAFPDPASARVLWMGVEGDRDALAELAASVRRVCNRHGATPDGQRFHPHLTVARLRAPQPQTHWVRVLQTYAGPPFEAAEVELIASSLHSGPGGRPLHETVSVANLRSGRESDGPAG